MATIRAMRPSKTYIPSCGNEFVKAGLPTGSAGIGAQRFLSRTIATQTSAGGLLFEGWMPAYGVPVPRGVAELRK